MEYLDNKHHVIDNTSEVKKKKEVHLKMSDKKEDLTQTNLSKDRVNITPADKPNNKFGLNKVSLTDKMMFIDNLSTMLRAGLSLSPALQTLSTESKNKYLKKVLVYLRQHVENGQLLSKGMKDFPKVFSEIMIATVEVGESTGMLSDTLGNLAHTLKGQKALRSRVMGALMYPSIVLIALIAVSLLLALLVFPQLIAIFEESNVRLPFVLIAVRGIKAFVQQYYIYILGAFVLLIVLLKVIFKLPKPKLLLHAFILKLPFVGRIVKELALTNFAANLHTLLSAGLAIVKSLEIVSRTLNNLQYRRAVLIMAQRLEKGISLDKAMIERPRLFPTLTIQLCQVGEKTGELEQILKKISEYYEERVNNVLANLSVIIEPILLLMVGVAVGFIAISVMGPMYELTLSFAN